jgi:hypothetical protein
MEESGFSVTQELPYFMEPKGSLLPSQESATGLNPESDKSSPHSHPICLTLMSLAD